MTPGPFQIVLVIVLVLLLFGAGKVPGVMENLAKGIKSFKKGLKDEDDASARSVSDQSDSSKDS